MTGTNIQTRRIGYARVSTYGKTLGAQLEQLRADGCATRVMRGLYAGLPRATALSLPVLQDRIFHLAGGTIAEIEITEA
jgi:hypothetical protein